MSTGNELVTLKQVNDYYKDLRKRSSPVIFNSAIGNPVAFSDGADGLPIQSLKVQLLPRQEGTGDASPENVRNIIPWNGLTVFGGGKNLLKYQTGQTRQNNGVNYAILSDGGQSCEGTATAASYAIDSLRTVLHAGMYTVSVSGAVNMKTVIVKNGAYFRQIAGNGQSTFSITEDTEIGCYSFANNGDTVDETIYVQLEVGQTASAYEPFVPITETDVVFPSPVYGGSHEAVSGKLISGWKTKTFDGSSDEVWYFVRVGESEYYRAYINMPDARQSNDVAILADSYKAVSFNDRSFSSKVCFMGNESETPVIFAFVTDLTTVEAFKTYLAENPLTICYQLATPVEIQLTPTQLQSLLGNNTIWSDANGDIEVEYRADTDKFISNAIDNQPHAANGGVYGIMTPGPGLSVLNDKIITNPAGTQSIKAGTSSNLIISPAFVGDAAFYGLARAAGVDMASLTEETVGVYPQAQKAAIQSMLGIEADIPLVETVTGATASITGMPNVRYICDTAISELTITPPASGSIVVRFTAGSNCIVSLPQTVKLPAWFDISSLEAGTTYEIIITDGVYGGVMSWA